MSKFGVAIGRSIAHPQNLRLCRPTHFLGPWRSGQISPKIRRRQSHKDRRIAELAKTTKKALRSSRLARRVPLRLSTKVWRTTYRRTSAHRSNRTRGYAAVLPLHHLSEPLHPRHRSLSRASRNCRQCVLRSRSRRDIFLPEPEDHHRRKLVQRHPALVISRTTGNARRILLLARLRSNDRRRTARRISPLRRQLRRPQANGSGSRLAQPASSGTPPLHRPLLQQHRSRRTPLWS